MLKRKRIACGLTSAAITTSILLGAVMPGVVMADEVTILSTGFEESDLPASGWGYEYYTDDYDWAWAIRNSEEISERTDGCVAGAYAGDKSAFLNGAAAMKNCLCGIESTAVNGCRSLYLQMVMMSMRNGHQAERSRFPMMS